MLNSLLSAAVLAAVVRAQTFSACNPMLKSGCAPDEAVGGTQFTDFTTSVFTSAKSGSSSPDPDWTYEQGTSMSFNSNGAQFVITNSQAPTIDSTKYIMFGKVDVYALAAPGTGIVSSFILESDDLDEIDWEWLGNDDAHVQANFYGKGNTTTYNRVQYLPVNKPIETVHKYTIDWTADRIEWLIDDNLARTLTFSDPLTLGGTNYPQTPMKIKMGNWIGCTTANPNTGTCQWTGGPAVFPAPNGAYTMSVMNVTIQDYGCATQYVYGDQTGSYQSIQKVGGCSGGGGSSSSGSSSTSTASSTGSASSGSSSSGSSASASSSSGSSSTSSGATTSATVTSSHSTSTGSTGSTMTTVTPTKSSTSSSTSSSSSSTASANAASGLKPYTFGALDFPVIAAALSLGFFAL